MNHVRIVASAVLMLTTSGVLISADVSAQRSGQRLEKALAASGSDADAREMVEVMMMVRLSRELELSEDETVLLVRRMSDFRGKLGKLHRDRRSLSAALRSTTQDSSNTFDEATLRKNLDDLKALDKRLIEVRLEMREKLSEGLDARQQARLYLFLQDFEENMRRMVQRVRDRSRALESGRMGPNGAGKGGPPSQRRMMRDEPPRGGHGRGGRGPGPRPAEHDKSPDRAGAESPSRSEGKTTPE